MENVFDRNCHLQILLMKTSEHLLAINSSKSSRVPVSLTVLFISFTLFWYLAEHLPARSVHECQF